MSAAIETEINNMMYLQDQMLKKLTLPQSEMVPIPKVIVDRYGEEDKTVAACRAAAGLGYAQAVKDMVDICQGILVSMQRDLMKSTVN